MDGNRLERHLAQAQRHAVQGASLIAEQRERVAKLERLGADCVHAKQLLARFEELQAMHADDAEAPPSGVRALPRIWTTRTN